MQDWISQFVQCLSVKQDIFFADVSNCVTALKKVVQEGNSKDIDTKLQLAQSSVRYESKISVYARYFHLNIIQGHLQSQFDPILLLRTL